MKYNIEFDEQLPARLKRIFYQVWKAYEPLHDHPLKLQYGNMKNMTMRAQPLTDHRFFFRRKRAYKIEIRRRITIDGEFELAGLPEPVIAGWFAHELGHLMDYYQRPWRELVGMAIGYLLSPIYRAGVERRADLFAIEYGFVEAIQATKRFILKKSNVPDVYLNRINKYYMTPEEIEEVMLGKAESNLFRDRIL